MNIQELFQGVFYEDVPALQRKLAHIKCYVFDWDGVFNNGYHPQQHNSIFSEVDSMGINLLRFSHYLEHGDVPIAGIVTGQNNEQAAHFVTREHLDFILRGYKNKNDALAYLKEQFRLADDQIAFVFDDVLDLPIAQVAGLRFQVGRSCNPYFNHYIEEHRLADYRTAVPGHENAVREVSELIASLRGNIESAFTHRLQWSDTYKSYWSARNATQLSDLQATY